MEFKIETEKFNAWFGKKHVLKNILLKIKTNSTTAIIGPSGCGKTTLLRCFDRMHETIPSAKISGKILFDGKNIYNQTMDASEIRRKIGMVFQVPNPFPMMSIYDNVAAGLKLNGVKDKTILDEAVETSLKQAHLWNEVKDELNKSGKSLSGGQQQRLCIARSLAVKPDVILMDEPCSALDAIATAKIEEEIKFLQKSYTVVIVTHNMQQAARVSKYTAFIHLGELIEYDSTKKIFESAQEQLTRDYIIGKFG